MKTWWVIETSFKFSEWENDSLSKKKEFIPKKSYEDLCWIILAKVKVCSKYLRDE